MNSDYIQLIFCIESTEKAAIDSKYINEILSQYYHIGENKISYVYMCGKHNYNHYKVLNKINKLIKDYQVTGSGSSHVIYVFDKDLNTKDYRDTQFETNVKKHCADQNYKLVWFVKTIEDVMWGMKVSRKEKKKKAIQFISKHQIKKVNKRNLEATANVNASHKSNILSVLNTFSQIEKN